MIEGNTKGVKVKIAVVKETGTTIALNHVGNMRVSLGNTSINAKKDNA
jgi:hypothetical protein